MIREMTDRQCTESIDRALRRHNDRFAPQHHFLDRGLLDRRQSIVALVLVSKIVLHRRGVPARTGGIWSKPDQHTASPEMVGEPRGGRRHRSLGIVAPIQDDLQIDDMRQHPRGGFRHDGGIGSPRCVNRLHGSNLAVRGVVSHSMRQTSPAFSFPSEFGIWTFTTTVPLCGSITGETKSTVEGTTPIPPPTT